MPIEFIRPEVDELKPRISVIGVGGAGGNAIANMIASQVQGVDFLVANTDAQALNSSPADRRIQLGVKIAQGLGAGSRPEIGRAAAEESLVQIEQAIEGSHMCFIAAGMGGGTGTGAAAVVAKAARDRGILTVGVVTKPFSFEGTRRMRQAEAGIEELQKHVDTLIVIPNQNLFLIANPDTTFKQAFMLADEVLQQGVRGITDLMVMPGLINLDFADIRSVMSEMGKAMMGTGEASGDHRALEAAEKAISNPLLDGVSMNGAKGVIISIIGGEDMKLWEIDEAANHIRQLVDPDANIIWGSAFNNDLDGKLRVSVVATGIEAGAMPQVKPSTTTSLGGFGTRTVGVPVTPPSPVEEPVAVMPEPVFEEVQAPTDIAASAEDELELIDSVVTDEFVLDQPETFETAAPQETLSAGWDFAPSEPVAESEYQPAPEPAPEAEPEARPARTGGTLFERMSNLARGNRQSASQAGDDENREPLDIPSFLGRQNNQ